MRNRVHLPVSAALLLVAAACGPVNNGLRGGGAKSQDGGIVLQGMDLQDGRGDLLNAMAGKVPNLRVRKPSDRCPQISLRTAVTFQAAVNPHVYVDGTRSIDTCILEMLRTGDVERIEIYPAGFTNRPGYGRHSNGLILVFMRGAVPRGETDRKIGSGLD